MKTEKEEWRTLDGIPGYAVSSEGRVYSRLTNRTLQQRVVRGYWYVNVTVAGRGYRKRVHRMVCEAFNGPSPEGKPLALHTNGDPLDNRPGNLRWGSHGENARDRTRHGTCRESRKTHCPSGHEYNHENTKVVAGSRTCAVCTRDRKRRAGLRGLPPGDPRHGTPTGYFNWGCRCGRCTDTALQYNRKRKIDKENN